jgi:hypothetical protein
MSHDCYVRALLRLYSSLPQTALRRPSSADRRLAAQLFDRGIPMATVQTAFLLAVERRDARPPELPPLPPIRSLAYFLPVIEELQLYPSDPEYLVYLLRRRQRVQNSTDSGDR